MSHEVESMVSVREVPWHGLGTIVENTLTAKEAMVAAGLDWGVELAPLTAMPSTQTQLQMEEGEPQTRVVPYTGDPIPVEGHVAVVRDSDQAVLSVMGSSYTPIQNHEAFAFFDAVVDSGEAKYETAGSLKGGRQIFMTAHIPQNMLVGGVDLVEWYLGLTTSHDGSRALTAAVNPIRWVCKNTLNYGLSKAKTTFSIRHTESAEGRIQEAREALGLTFKYADEFQKEADRLIQTEFTKTQFEEMVKQLVPEKARDDGNRQIRMAMIGTLESSDTLDDSFRYTAWGAINTVAEYQDWVRPVRNSKIKSEAEVRTEAAWFGPSVKIKNDARSLVLSMVGS